MLSKTWVLLVVVPAAILTLSCAKSDRSPTETGIQNDNVLRIDIPEPFGSLDPAKGSQSASSNVFPLLYSYLFVPNEAGQLEPDLATRWDYDAAGFTWTIQLRDDALFHDGRRVTAEDAEYSLEYCLKSVHPDLFGLIDRVTPLTDAFLLIRLKRNDPGFARKIWDLPILPHPAVGAPGTPEHPVGSGPFKFNYRDGSHEVGLTAYDGYYGGRPSLDGIVFTCEPNSEKSWTRLLSGKTDIGVRLSFKDYRMLRIYNDAFYLNEMTLEPYMILLFNTTDPIFAEPNVRLALAYAVDKQTIVDRVFHGAATMAAGPAGVNSPWHNPEVKPVPYHPGRALELLRQAGWRDDPDDHFLYRRGEAFEFTILISEGDQLDRLVAEYLQIFLNQIGIKAHLSSLSQDELFRRYAFNNEFQAVLTQFGASSRSPELIECIWTGMNGQKAGAGAFEHPLVAALLHEAARVKDPDRSTRLYQEADALITSLQPGMFLVHEIRLDVMSKRFRLPQPFSFTYSGISRLRHASLSQTRSP
jgi:peptide/nickel transport system substrate-binding protein